MSTPTKNEIAAWRAFLEAHQAVMRNFERTHDENLDLPLSWYDVLVQLSEAPEGRLRMTDLAEAVLLSRSGLTRLVDRMEKRGFVRREVCETDRRGYFAVLAPEGRDALREATPVHMRGIAEHFTNALDDEEIAVVERVMTKVAEVNGSRTD